MPKHVLVEAVDMSHRLDEVSSDSDNLEIENAVEYGTECPPCMEEKSFV